MPDDKSIGDEKGSDSWSHANSDPRERPNPLGWMLVICAIAALVYIPAVLTGEQGAWQQVGQIPSTDEVPTIVLDEINIDGPFGVTPAWEVATTNATGSADLHVLIGSNGSGSNRYQIATAGGLPVRVTSNHIHVDVITTNASSVGSHIGDLDGSCCAAYEGGAYESAILTALSFPGSNTEVVEISVDPPYTVVSSDLGAGPQISAWFEFQKNRNIASTFGTSTNAVDVLTQTPPGDWAQLTTVGRDSVFNNTHWGQASSHDGSKIFITGRHGGPVDVTQIDADTGVHDWEYQIDFVASPPSGFVYQQCCYAQSVDFPGGGTGDALACVSPDDAGVDISLFGPVGGPNPPQFFQEVSFPGAVTDRQAFSCAGGMIYYHRPDPDGTGVLTSVINCNGLAGPCTSVTHEDNTRNMVFSAFPPDSVIVQGVHYPLITDQTIVIEGTETNIVNVVALDLPISFYNHEAGDLTQYHNVVGEVP